MFDLCLPHLLIKSHFDLKVNKAVTALTTALLCHSGTFNTFTFPFLVSHQSHSHVSSTLMFSGNKSLMLGYFIQLTLTIQQHSSAILLTVHLAGEYCSDITPELMNMHKLCVYIILHVALLIISVWVSRQGNVISPKQRNYYYLSSRAASNSKH